MGTTIIIKIKDKVVLVGPVKYLVLVLQRLRQLAVVTVQDLLLELVVLVVLVVVVHGHQVQLVLVTHHQQVLHKVLMVVLVARVSMLSLVEEVAALVQ